MSSQGPARGDGHGRRWQMRLLKGSVGARMAGVAVAALLTCLTMAAGASAQSVCTDTWTGPGAGNWETAADWATGNVPTSSDVACIGAGDTVDVSEGTAQAGVVQGEGALALSGGTLELTAALAASSIASLSLSRASLAIADELDVSSGFTGGGSGASTISGTGRLVVGSGVTGTVGGGERCSRLVLDGVTLVNQGTLTFGAPGGAEDGPIWMENGAQLQNAGTFDDDSTESGGCGYGNQPSIYDNGGATPSITNTGTFQSTNNEEPISIGVPFENQGTVSPQTGTLQLSGGGTSTSGAFTPASGATLAFTGDPYTLTDGSWSGAGTVSVQGANLSASGLQSTSAQVNVISGSLTIPEGSTDTVSSGSLTIAGNPAAVDGPGKLVVGASATGTINTSRCQRAVLNGVTLLNQGTLTAGTATGADDGPIWMENGAQLQNTGTFNDNTTEPGGCGYGNQPSIYDNGGATPSITNTGTFQSTDNEEPIEVGVALDNQGDVRAPTRTLRLPGGSSAAGAAFSPASGATLEFASGSFTLSSAKWSGAGTIALTGASVSATSLQSTSAQVNVISGSLTIA